ncbi:cytosolic sulfotransferase 12-like [Papaver somniferum]|uniref:cytosolic sulfotransferase 12-like n=1 Tax=Papaver somniferum TaxID=3469 RepID=UPI000E702D6B|nr:cytosolic sulfotransferase 12-like [Papaver somniferum]
MDPTHLQTLYALSRKGLKQLGQSDLTEEVKNLLSSLPKKNGWLTSAPLYQYQNFWYPAVQLQALLNIQRNFQALDTDLVVVTNPKCGTTWLKALSFAIVNRFQFHFDNPTSKQYHPLLTNNPHILVPYLEYFYMIDQNPDLTCLSFGTARLLSTHIPHASLPDSIKDSKCKLVYLCRDPKDTFISFWHFSNKLRPKNTEDTSFEEAFEKFCEGVVDFGPFWDNVLGYWKMSLESPERVCFLKYEEMKKEPKIHLLKLAEFLGVPFSVEEENDGVPEQILKLCSFDNLSNLEVNKTGKIAGIGFSVYFRRGEVGDHVNHLTLEMIERFDKINEQKFLDSGGKENEEMLDLNRTAKRRVGKT